MKIYGCIKKNHHHLTQKTRNVEHGTWNTERGTRNVEHGTWNTERETRNAFKDPNPHLHP